MTFESVIAANREVAVFVEAKTFIKGLKIEPFPEKFWSGANQIPFAFFSAEIIFFTSCFEMMPREYLDLYFS